jgi:hypothetical protein
MNAPPDTTDKNRGWAMFFILLAFVSGNGLSFFVFGLNTVKVTDFNNAVSEFHIRQDQTDQHIQTLQDTINDMRGQLKAKAMLQP